jgi:hypothetical protein
MEKKKTYTTVQRKDGGRKFQIIEKLAKNASYMSEHNLIIVPSVAKIPEEFKNKIDEDKKKLSATANNDKETKSPSGKDKKSIEPKVAEDKKSNQTQVNIETHNNNK